MAYKDKWIESKIGVQLAGGVRYHEGSLHASVLSGRVPWVGFLVCGSYMGFIHIGE